MSWTLELRATGDIAIESDANAWLVHDALRVLLSLQGATCVDVYSPLRGARDPFVMEEAGPLVFAMTDFADENALRSAVVEDALDSCMARAPDGLAFTATPLLRTRFPMGNPSATASDAAPYRYVVRYHGPPEAAAGFAAHYRRTHPPLLAKLPRIRAIECYEQVGGFRALRMPPADYLVGNEVEFDSADDFNAAMASPARVALRADFEALPPVFHTNTHFAMRPSRHHAGPRSAERNHALHQAEL
jgi:uncharacterized protein (TIGR02118 family)